MLDTHHWEQFRLADYDVPCVNCDKTDCDGADCMAPDPEDGEFCWMWEEDMREWREAALFGEATP